MIISIETAVGRFEQRLSEEVGKLRADVATFHAQTIRWMFVFWIGQVFAVLGILFAFFR